jgi:hypothetical protein
MPSRFASIAILVAWMVSLAMLLQRDVLPDLLIGPPPDLRTITRAGGAGPHPEDDGLVRWSILVADDKDAEDLRTVGLVETNARRAKDGWFRMMSTAWFDAGALLKGSALGAIQNERVEIRGVSDIDPVGNLDSFRASVRLQGVDRDALVISGQVRHNDLEVQAQGMSPMLNWARRFPYQPRQMVQHEFGPMGHMPGLQVGQRWKSQVVSPLTGQVESAQIAVERKRIISWDGNPVTTLEVVTRFSLLSARTWVRSDGLVLRQEVPFPLARIILERIPKRFIGPGARGMSR